MKTSLLGEICGFIKLQIKNPTLKTPKVSLLSTNFSKKIRKFSTSTQKSQLFNFCSPWKKEKMKLIFSRKLKVFVIFIKTMFRKQQRDWHIRQNSPQRAWRHLVPFYAFQPPRNFLRIKLVSYKIFSKKKNILISFNHVTVDKNYQDLLQAASKWLQIF